jgi:hypothetical protein
MRRIVNLVSTNSDFFSTKPDWSDLSGSRSNSSWKAPTGQLGLTNNPEK